MYAVPLYRAVLWYFPALPAPAQLYLHVGPEMNCTVTEHLSCPTKMHVFFLDLWMTVSQHICEHMVT